MRYLTKDAYEIIEENLYEKDGFAEYLRLRGISREFLLAELKIEQKEKNQNLFARNWVGVWVQV